MFCGKPPASGAVSAFFFPSYDSLAKSVVVVVCLSTLRQMVVGWYHSHPGFGCWLSGVDINTQQSFEQLNARAVSIVVDPIQSVKGKVRGSLRSGLYVRTNCRSRSVP